MNERLSKSDLAPPRPDMAPPGPEVPAWLPAVLLAVVTVALYWPALGCGFIFFDDGAYVTSNPHVQGGLTVANIIWAFTTDQASNWHPLTWLSLMLDVNIFGNGPAGFHFTNVALHAANVGLLFWLLRLLTGAVGRSALVAAFFGWHPMHVESVAWISERKDVLSTFFGFLSLIFYVRYARSPAARPLPNSSFCILHSAFILSLCCFALGLMSKPMLVTWPFVMLLLDYWPLSRRFPFQPSAFSLQPFREKAPFFALAVAACVATFLVQQHGDSVMPLGKISPGMRIENALVADVRYLGKLMWPTDLAIFYPHPGHWPMVLVLAALLLLTAISAFAFWQRRRQPALLVGWLWYLGTLLPVIGLVQVGDQAMADRYVYIPSIGWLILMVWGGHELVRGRTLQMVLSAGAVTAAIFCCAGTRHQLGYWRTSEGLLRHTVAITTNNFVALDALGATLAGEGRVDEAIGCYREVLRLQPGFADTLNNLGRLLADEGRLTEAIGDYQQAIQSNPGFAPARNNLGVALAKQGRLDDSVREFQETLRLDPDYAEAHNNLGMAELMKGDTDTAVRQFQEAIRLRPGYAAAQVNLARALARKNGSAPVGQPVKPDQP